MREYSYFDWSGGHTLRKLMSRFIFILNRGLVSQSSKKQTTIALSLIEVEYVALIFGIKKVT